MFNIFFCPFLYPFLCTKWTSSHQMQLVLTHDIALKLLISRYNTIARIFLLHAYGLFMFVIVFCV